jgi:putative intracellular protease/amidase
VDGDGLVGVIGPVGWPGVGVGDGVVGDVGDVGVPVPGEPVPGVPPGAPWHAASGVLSNATRRRFLIDMPGVESKPRDTSHPRTPCEHAAMAKVLFPLPDHDFDVTEVAVPWKLLVEAGHEVGFATEAGAKPACDPLLLTGVVFGKLGAHPEPIAFYRELERAAAFASPRTWQACRADDYDALVLAGGHAPGMRQYLGNTDVQALTTAFFAGGKPIAAICHGVLVAARSKRADGASVLHGRKTTCLPKYMERSAFLATFWRRGRYYRTYPAYVEDEVRAALANPDADFVRGPRELSKRGTRDDDSVAFVVEDGNYVSARWPGDAYLFVKKLLARL